MKKWKTLANPTDPSHWADVSNMWPTGRGSYETSDVYGSATNISATGETGAMISAWAFNTLSGSRAYYFGNYLWELDSTLATATDRTGALGADAVVAGHACQYGDITVVARGTSGSLITSSGGNFAALAGSPSAKFVCVQSNVLLAFNTSANSDAWAASDVGDYTNWTTGEAASGRILENNGPITGCIAWGNDVIAFKSDSIFRMTYVGGLVKWQVQRIWNGIGLPAGNLVGGSYVCATPYGLFFPGGRSNSTGRQAYFLFDGTSPPRQVNLEVDTQWGAGIPLYDAHLDMVTVYVYRFVGSSDYRMYIYYYSPRDDAWGASAYIPASAFSSVSLPIRGDSAALANFTGGGTPARPLFSGTVAALDLFVKRAASVPTSAAGSSYIQTHKMSLPRDGVFGEDQTTFGPAAPVLRRRLTYSSGSPALALTVDTYQEAHDTSAAATASVTESTIRDRFDFTKSASFCQLKLTATDTDIEIDDISVKMKPAGKI